MKELHDLKRSIKRLNVENISSGDIRMLERLCDKIAIRISNIERDKKNASK